MRKVGIVGLGMVGGAMHRYFQKQKDVELFVYDKGKNIGSYEEVNKADYIFVCVPTPFKDGKCDTSIVEEVVSNLGDKIIIIKSTVPPGTTARLQEQYPNKKMLFNPEFLTEQTADQDMDYPDRQIIGHTTKSFTVAADVLALLPLAPFERIVGANIAEFVKYAGNTWFSVKVAKNNELYDLVIAAGGSDAVFEDIAECMAADKRIGRTHLAIWHKDYRGYGGSCLKGSEKIYQRIRDKAKSISIKSFIDGYRQGDKVLAYDIKNNSIIEDEVINVSQRKSDNLIKIYYQGKRSITVTDDHPMLIVHDGKMTQVLAKDIKDGDEFLVSNRRIAVKVICDECGREYKTSFCKLQNIQEKTGGHYCDRCYMKYSPIWERNMRQVRADESNKNPNIKLKRCLAMKGVNKGDKNAMKRKEVSDRVSQTRMAKFRSGEYSRDAVSQSVRQAWADGKFDGVKTGRCKWYSLTRKNGEVIKLQGTWEVKFAEWLESKNLDFYAHKGRIKYVDNNGIDRSYYPDFYVKEWGTYIDTKADWWIAKTKDKWNSIFSSNPNLPIEILGRQKLVALGIKL